jgi:hypothetical protein
MTTSFEFETVEELQQFAENARDEICSCILLSLTKAFEDREIEPVIFTLNVENSPEIFEMYLQRQEWNKALSVCLDYFTVNNSPDQAIDTYFLIQKIDQEVA